ncbi:hypothetical protein F7Q92_19705 [Ideonella dechloratans]|uniref:Uncharacterized protein n=1 Tax=Ideonella dechloratans TaxID=36863 RepID=A0A643F747_IDEDE|nr:hypothetical protein [Ideonella dechloratans]KAB0574346.1 hypothetical protein F7Q92_19705 [Ideonella dechloratans]UFU10771.1 hypothetical protein LRM40_03540 [Ideonella dechloratans]
MRLEIDHLALQLPAGFEARAPRIARLLGDALARPEHLGGLRLAHNAALPALQLPPLAVQTGHSDAAIAQRLAQAVTVQVHSALAASPLAGGSAR